MWAALGALIACSVPFAVVQAETVLARVHAAPVPELAAAPVPGENPAGLESLRWTSALVVLPHGQEATAVRAVGAAGVPHEAFIASTTGDHGATVALIRIALAGAGQSPGGADGRPGAILDAATSATDIQIEVDTAPSTFRPRARLRYDAGSEARIRAGLRARVANPADVNRFVPQPAPRPREPDKTGGRGTVTGDPSLDGNGVRYLIVTTQALVPSFEKLAAWKRRRGVRTEIRTIEWIESRTRHGVDRAETLRNFLVEAYQLWGVEYVLLGGDTDLLTPRLAFSLVFGGSTTPTELYFSCLDGTWNADTDDRWGEGSLVPGPGESDIVPELAVSRAPVNDVAQAETFVSRVIGYETPLFTDYQTRAAFLTEVLVPANWDSGQAVAFNGAPTSDAIMNLSMPPSFTFNRLYDTYWQFAGSEKLTRERSIEVMNTGLGIVNHLGHGFRYTMSLGNGSLVNADADALVNGGRSFFLCMANCAAVAYDYNCLAERFLLNPGGGAAAVIGASRSVSANLVTIYDRALFRQMFELGVTHVADALNAMRLERASLAELDGGERWIQLCLNALGDPETPIFSGPVVSVEVAHASTLPVGSSNLEVAVTVASSPRHNAVVTAMKDNEVYATGSTDVMGLVQLPVSPATPGWIQVFVSGQNVAMFADSVWVEAGAGAVLAVGGRTVDDDALAPSAGNGDGALDAGETLEIEVQIQNRGSSGADSVTAVLSSGNPLVTVLQDSATVDSLAAGSTVTAGMRFVVHLDPALLDGTAVDLPVHLTTRGGGAWEDWVHLLVCAPRLEVVRSVYSTGGHSGQVLLQLEVKNFGSGQQPPFLAIVSAPDTAVAVTQDTMQFAAIAGLATGTAAPQFEFATPAGAWPDAAVAITDLYGRTSQVPLLGQQPVAPPIPTADLGFAAGTVRLTWTPSADYNRYGYHVFRAVAGSSSFQQITPDAIRHADFYDTQVVPNSRYDYYVVALNNSRVWSTPSPVRSVNTVAASVPGWPVEMAEATASSAGVGDLDGDGGMEIVVGDNGVYAWHANGQEVRDGDANATTDGVFSTASGTMNASIALADLDSLPGLEIVGASWLTNKIFVWNSHGDLLPGWPRQPARGGNTGYWASPAVSDLDADGIPEVVAISKDGNLYAWHADGTPLVPAFGDGFVATVGAWTQTTPALVDLDFDGQREIIVSGSLARVFVFRADGSAFPGWPRDLYALGKGSPAVGDLDGDGDLDIVITSESDHVWVFNPDGTLLPGWPKQVSGDAPDLGPSPALGDMDGDGHPDIVLCSVRNPFNLSKIFVFNAAGTTLFTKQLESNSQSSPVLADLDGDGSIDILHGGEAGVLHAWNLAGAELAGFPIPVGDYIRGTPQYCDVDGDGMGDLVLAGWNKKVYAWKMTGPYRPERAPWPMFHGDLARTGFLRPAYPSPAGDPLPAARLAAQWAPNPFNPSVNVRLSVPGTGTAPVPVQVDIYDANGRRLRRLLDAPLAPGTTRLVWNGRDDANHALSSGIYFYRVRMAHETLRGKLTLLR